MLSKEEKDEMLRDGQNPERKKDFRVASVILGNRSSRSLDKFLDYLHSVQAVFHFPDSSRKRIITDKNIL